MSDGAVTDSMTLSLLVQAQNQYQEHVSDTQAQSSESSPSRQGGGAEQYQKQQGMYEIEEQPEEGGGGGGGGGETDQQESPLQESLRMQRSPHHSETRTPNERVMNVLQVSRATLFRPYV